MRRILRILMMATGIAFFIVLLIMLYFLNQAPNSNVVEENRLKEPPVFHFIAIIPRFEEDPYFQDIVEAFKLAGEKNRSIIQVFEYERVSGEKELMDIMSMCIALSPDGVILSVADTKANKNGIDAMENARIPVITLETDIPESRRHAFVGTNAFSSGFLTGSFVASRTNAKTEIAIIVPQTNREVSPRNNTFVMGFIKGTANNPHVTLSLVRPMKEGELASEEIMRGMLVENPGIGLAIFPGARDTEGAAQTLIDFNRVGKIAVIGFDESPEMRSFIDQGVVMAAIIRNPSYAGVLCVETLVSIHRKDRVNAYMDPGVKILTQDGIWNDLP